MTGSTSAERLVAYLLGEADELSEADVNEALDAEQLPRLLDVVAAKRETGESKDAEEVWELIAFLAGNGASVTDEADSADAHLIRAVYDLLRLEDQEDIRPAAGSFADVGHWLGGCAQADALDQELALDEALSAFAETTRLGQDVKDWLAHWSLYGITPVTWWRAKRAIELEVQRRLRGGASRRGYLLLYRAEPRGAGGAAVVAGDEIVEEVRLSARCSDDVARACYHWICALAQRRPLLFDGLRIIDTSASGLLLERDADAEPDTLTDRLLARLARQRQRWRERRHEVVEPIGPSNAVHARRRDGIMKLDSLRDLYIDQLQDLYSAEEQLTKALPKMIDAAAHPELKSALRHHLQETEQHVKRLEAVLGDLAGTSSGGEGGIMERVYRALGRSPAGKKGAAMAGLISEGEEVVKASGDQDVRDAGLIAAAQRVEHYEIAGYGTVCTYAEMLGRSADKERLGHTLAEEKATDEKLNTLAKQIVNVDAATRAI